MRTSHLLHEPSALRILNPAGLAIPALAVTAIVVANVWFCAIPLFGINDSGTYIWRFPFGSVDYQVEPVG
ncbi:MULTISPECIES: hypothetical protein [Microbacterium]|uniref:Uncharacterized protein n=1 Tax=Microbacterium wangchenii TaxID=2541726 RepID=A0ABX5SN42_9MICO|nr:MULTISPECIES: hypothetical protein [Microbacterium]MCK6068241.1 hypothetical protein [Microbacterium sp. EYE_512]QBR87526.1 hypothetical protein E4K62_01740 [Microbacterium wangchenii]TXK15794.1 hypothetical protein FVP99_09840 [Microbacterium wangchenii]